ncbi:MAG: FtsX-like permease family protein [Deltaproteobacteria bacterium]|nr:FtsX-like permease family protein [Deltaproteobacteria bacterium]MCX7952559.1 FtsX-like permease family protein [Deltaproteobacteria bacterium]
MTFENLVVFRYLTTSKQESFLRIMVLMAFFAIMLGNAVLVSVVSIMNGFQKEIRNMLIHNKPHIIAYGSEKDLINLISKINLSSILDKSISFQSPAMLMGRWGSTGVIIQGRLNLRSDQDNIYLSKATMKALGVVPGDIVKVFAPTTTLTPFGSLPKMRSFVVKDLASDSLEYVGLVDFSSGKIFFEPSVYLLELKLIKPEEAKSVKSDILKMYGDELGAVSLSTWIEQNEPLWNALQMEKTAYFIVLTLIILVASFSVSSALIMFVLEKRKELAIFTALGANQKSLQRIFFKLGTLLGLLGTSAGLVIGFIFCLLLDYYGFPLDERVFGISKLPVEFSLKSYVLVGVVSMVICAISTLYPVKRVANLKSSIILRE